MTQNAGEQVAVGLEHIRVLGGLPYLGYHLAFDRNQVEDMAGSPRCRREPSCRQVNRGAITGACTKLSRNFTRFKARKPFSTVGNPTRRRFAHAQRAPTLGLIQRLLGPSWSTNAVPG